MQRYLMDELEKEELILLVARLEEKVDNLRRGLFARYTLQQKKIEELQNELYGNSVHLDGKVVQLEFNFIHSVV
jgi:hypothetical protein